MANIIQAIILLGLTISTAGFLYGAITNNRKTMTLLQNKYEQHINQQKAISNPPKDKSIKPV
jgi:hypothetical protein